MNQVIPWAALVGDSRLIARLPFEELKAYTDRHRDTYGVEPICKVLHIASSCKRHHVARLRNPALWCALAQHDCALIPHIQRVWQTNIQLYSADKVGKQMNRAGNPDPLHVRAVDEALGYIPPAEAEENYYRQLASQTAILAGLNPTGLQKPRGDSGQTRYHIDDHRPPKSQDPIRIDRCVGASQVYELRRRFKAIQT